MLSKALNTGADVIAGLDFVAIDKILTDSINGFFVGVGNFLVNLDAKTYAIAGLAVLGAAAVVVVGGMAAALVGAAVAAVSASVALLVAAGVFLFAALAKAIYENWDFISKVASEGFAFWTENIKLSFGVLWDIFTGNWAGVRDKATRIFDQMRVMFTWLGDRIRDTLNFFRREQPTQTPLATATAPRLGFATSRANGDLGSLIGAAMAERMAAPNDGLVVANTSEAILNRRQQATIANALRTTSGFTIEGGIHVSSNASDPRQVATEVMAEIERRFARFQQNQVTAVAT